MRKATIDEILTRDEGAPDREARVRRGFWRTMARAAGRIPFAEELAAAYYCALDPRTPLKARGTLLAALAYFVLPVDLVPDFVMVFGFTDDIAVLTAALAAVRANIRPHHREAAQAALARIREGGTPA